VKTKNIRSPEPIFFVKRHPTPSHKVYFYDYRTHQ